MSLEERTPDATVRKWFVDDAGEVVEETLATAE